VSECRAVIGHERESLAFVCGGEASDWRLLALIYASYIPHTTEGGLARRTEQTRRMDRVGCACVGEWRYCCADHVK